MAISGVQGTNSPNIIIQEASGSPYGFSTVNTSWVFGTVKVTYPGCLKYNIDDVVFYDKSQARRFVYGSTNYFAIDEQYVFFIETPLS